MTFNSERSVSLFHPGLRTGLGLGVAVVPTTREGHRTIDMMDIPSHDRTYQPSCTKVFPGRKPAHVCSLEPLPFPSAKYSSRYLTNLAKWATFWVQNQRERRLQDKKPILTRGHSRSSHSSRKHATELAFRLVTQRSDGDI